MKTKSFLIPVTCLLLGAVVFTAACGQKNAQPQSSAHPHKHEHHAPHGGTPVVLGAEAFHLELVLDPAGGRLQAFLLDGEMENFVRTDAASFEVVAVVGGAEKILTFKAVANPATGETVGDSSLFESEAEWLKTTKAFDATLTRLTVRGAAFSGVKFNFPQGNDHDAD